MNKTDLIHQVSEKTGFSNKVASQVVDAVFQTIQQSLVDEGQARVMGFGSFLVRERAVRRVRSPQTGQEIIVPPRKVPIFKPGTPLKMAVKTQELKNRFRQIG